MYLAIETSCDDTCAAILTRDGRPVSSIVSGQLIHGEYAGVVPELASREHLRLLLTTIRLAMAEAGVGWEEIRGIAVTQGPGLVGCLLVGLSLAKGIALGRGLPLVGVNHIEGHLHAVRAERAWEPPFLALVASGGHTEILHARAWGDYELLGATRDDAAGEAFDKVAKLLNLGFPGGPAIDRLAASGNPRAYDFPRAYLGLSDGDLDVSFSGLKTAVKLFLERSPDWDAANPSDRFVADVCASFQAALVDVLIAKLEAGLDRTRAPRLLLCGGVACNSSLRRRAEALGARFGVAVGYPSPALCADNATMIGLAGLRRLEAGEDDGLALTATPNLDDFPAFAGR